VDPASKREHPDTGAIVGIGVGVRTVGCVGGIGIDGETDGVVDGTTDGVIEGNPLGDEG